MLLFHCYEYYYSYMFITHPHQSIEDVDPQNNMLPLVPSSEFEGYADPAELNRHNNQLQASYKVVP